MEQAGLIHCPHSQHSSSLHVISKANSGSRPNDDYRRLNETTIDERSSLPNIQDFNSFFSKIVFVRGYHRILLASCSIPKTALATPFEL